jgi:hypothetical protein
MIHVVACESQPVVVEGVRRGLAATHDLTLVGAVSDPKALTELVARLSDVVVVNADSLVRLKITSPHPAGVAARSISSAWNARRF